MNTAPESSHLMFVASLGNRIFFSANDVVHGEEPWVSDGTKTGTRLVKDIVPGIRGSGPRRFTSLRDRVLFFAEDQEHGGELWGTDGTEAGTRLLKDIALGRKDSHPMAVALLGDRLCFTARDLEHGHELWVSDGTEAGTQLLKDIQPGEFGSIPRELRPAGDRLFFTVYMGNRKRELWTTDGTPVGTRKAKDIQNGPPGTPGWIPMACVGRRLFFAAWEPTQGTELWMSDGTEAGTRLLKDIVPGPEGSEPRSLAAAGDRLFFSAADPEHGRELWMSDGTEAGTRIVKDIALGTAGSDPGNRLIKDRGTQGYDLGEPAALRGCLFFAATDPEHGRELWMSDGTEAGTRLVKDIAQGIAGSEPGVMVGVLGDRLFFAATDPEHGRELWTTDGTEAGTRLVKDIAPGTEGSGPSRLDIFQDGRPDPWALGAAGGLLFFAATDPEHGRELWATDGTEAGTRLVKDIAGGTRGSPEFRYCSMDGPCRSLTPLGDRVFYAACDPGQGDELWTSDGTEAGTRLVRDIVPGPGGSEPHWITPVGQRLFFAATDPEHGAELWTSDGTEAGTRLVKDILQGSQGSLEETRYLEGCKCPRFEVKGDRLLFEARDRERGEWRVWMSDGTEAGTLPVEDGVAWGALTPFTLGGRFFLGTDPEHGDELWTSDGTKAGTRLLKDIYPGPQAGCESVVRESLRFFMERVSLPPPLARAGDRVFFAARDPEHGEELWSTDGTEEGTRLVWDIVPGSGGSAPQWPTPAGGRLFFWATDLEHGRELWALPLDGAGK